MAAGNRGPAGQVLAYILFVLWKGKRSPLPLWSYKEGNAWRVCTLSKQSMLLTLRV